MYTHTNRMYAKYMLALKYKHESAFICFNTRNEIFISANAFQWQFSNVGMSATEGVSWFYIAEGSTSLAEFQSRLVEKSKEISLNRQLY